jgi:hypothetical protein
MGVAASAAGIAFSSPDVAPGEACGLGPPPGSPQFAERQARDVQEIAHKGYLTVCAANLERFDVTSSLKPLKRAAEGLAFTPLDLSHTPFAQFSGLGGMQESVGDKKSRLYRAFRDTAGRTVTLFEHEMSADGSTSYRDPKDEPERINGLPARLSIFQTGSGKKAVSVLSWQEGRRYLELWVDANVALEPKRAALFALAQSLPKSVPARPNAPQRPPPKLGPDGLPIIDFPPMLPPDAR